MGTQPSGEPHFQIGENKWEDPNKRLFGVEGTGQVIKMNRKLSQRLGVKEGYIVKQKGSKRS